MSKDISSIVSGWPYDANEVRARWIQTDNGARQVQLFDADGTRRRTIDTPRPSGLFYFLNKGRATRPGEIYGYEDTHHTGYAFLMWDQRFLTPTAHLALGLTLRGEGHINVFGGGTFTYRPERAPDDKPIDGSPQGDIRVGAGARLDYEDPSGTYHANLRAGAQISPGMSDIRDSDDQPARQSQGGMPSGLHLGSHESQNPFSVYPPRLPHGRLLQHHHPVAPR